MFRLHTCFRSECWPLDQYSTRLRLRRSIVVGDIEEFISSLWNAMTGIMNKNEESLAGGRDAVQLYTKSSLAGNRLEESSGKIRPFCERSELSWTTSPVISSCNNNLLEPFHENATFASLWHRSEVFHYESGSCFILWPASIGDNIGSKQ